MKKAFEVIAILLLAALATPGCIQKPQTSFREYPLTVSSTEIQTLKPAGPFTITMSLLEAPTLNKPVKLIVNVTSVADAPDASIEILKTEGITIIEGGQSWKGGISKGEAIKFEIMIKAIKTGDQEIAIRASRKEVWGVDSNSISLYIDVGEKSSTVSKKPKYTPPSKRQPERPYYVKLRVSGTPSLNNPVDLTVTIASPIDQSKANINLLLSEGFELIEGSPKWSGALSKFPIGEATIKEEDIKREVAKGRQPMDVIFDFIPSNKQVDFKVKIKAVKTGDWQIIALPFEERPYAVECNGIDNPTKIRSEDPWNFYTVGGCLNIRVKNETALVSEVPLPPEHEIGEGNLTQGEQANALPTQIAPR